LKEIRETPNGRIAISENRDQVTLFLNNSLSFESQSTQAEEFVHLPLLCSNHPQRVLLIGGCGEGVLKEVKKYNPEVVDVVELSKEFVELPQKYIKDDRFASLKNKGAKFDNWGWEEVFKKLFKLRCDTGIFNCSRFYR